MWKFALLLLVCFSAQASETDAQTKASVYETCQAECVPTQKAASVNRSFSKFPFVLVAYCSCYCSRLAMRISAEALDQINIAALKGNAVESVPEAKQLIENSNSVCRGLLYK